MAVITSISLPPLLRRQLDDAARHLGRSRSQVVAEAVRAYLARHAEDPFAAARDRTLRDALRATLAERLRLSEELWQEFSHGRPRPAPFTAAFETLEEYEAWRQGAR